MQMMNALNVFAKKCVHDLDRVTRSSNDGNFAEIKLIVFLPLPNIEP